MPPRSVAYYAGQTRRLLSKSVFAPARSRLLWLPVHLLVIVTSTALLTWLSRHGAPWPALLPLSIVLGVSFAGLTFLGHETLHGAVVRHKGLRSVVGWIGFLPFVVSPRLWTAWHNRVHHGHTNHVGTDPDCYPTLLEYRSSRAVRVATDWAAPGRRRLRGLLSLVIGFSVQSTHMLLAARRRGYLSARQHALALAETALGIVLWAAVAFVIGALPFVFAFVLPLLVANVMVMAHILTNHSLSPLGTVNDPLQNTLSVTVPRSVEWLTLGFGYHVEHHIFPAMSARHAPEVRDALRRLWPERYQSMPLAHALLRLHRTPRVYKDDHTLIDPHTGSEWQVLSSEDARPRSLGGASSELAPQP